MNTHQSVRLAALALAALGLSISSAAQGRGGGRRGPPQSVSSRAGAVFVEATAPAIQAGVKAVDGLASTAHVEACAKAGELSLLYLFDPLGDKKKHQRFEPQLFNHADVNVALRLFKCARVDLAMDAAAEQDFGSRAPLFVVFDAKGKLVGELSMKGYKANSSGLVKLLGKAAKGYAKTTLSSFVKSYQGFLKDLTLLEGRKKTLDDKRTRLEKKDGGGSRGKLAKLDKDVAKLTRVEEKLFAGERKLLQKAAVPEPDPKAVRVGRRQRRRR